MALGSLGKLFVEIGADTKGLKKGLDGAESQINAFGGKVKKTGAAIGAGMSKTGRGMTAGITLPLVAAGAGFIALSGKAANFENQMNEVFTLMPGMSAKAMDAMTKDVLDFSKEMGTLPEEAVPALYQAISAGVPKDNVFDFLTVANKAAIGGVTDLETAVDGITSVVNAYGSDVVDAAEASDLMFTAVKLGKTNFNELSQSLFQVIPTASALGVEFGDVTAALAAMTAQGTPTRVATTQLRQLFVELSKDTGKASSAFKEIAGVGFADFIAQGGNVQDALVIMEQAADANGVSLQNMFGSVEAGNAALALTGKGAETFGRNLEEMAGAAGATNTAFATMDEGAARSMAKLKAEFSAAMITIGNDFIPILKDDLLPIFRDDLMPLLTGVVIPGIKAVAGAFSAMSPGMKKVALVVLALAAALGPVLMILGPIISGVTALAPVVAAVGAVIGGVALGPIVLIVAAIAAVIAILWVLEERFGVITAVINIVKDAFFGLIDWLSTAVPAAIEMVIGFLSGLGDKLLFMLGPIGAVIYAFRHWDEIKGIVSGAVSGIPGIVSGAISRAVGAITSLYGAFRNAGRAIMNALRDGILSGISAAVAAVRSAAAKLRSYLPGSDAKTGPLSDLMASGKALMTTFDAGMNAANVDLSGTMEHVLPSPATLTNAAPAASNGSQGGSVSNSNSISIGEVHLSKDYDFEQLMKDIDRHQAGQRTQRGFGAI